MIEVFAPGDSRSRKRTSLGWVSVKNNLFLNIESFYIAAHDCFIIYVLNVYFFTVSSIL